MGARNLSTASTSKAIEAIEARLERIEAKLFGNGESLLEKVTRIETVQQQLLQALHEEREKFIRDATLSYQSHMEKVLGEQRDLLSRQVAAQTSSNRMQMIGLWVAILSIVLGYIITRALGV